MSKLNLSDQRMLEAYQHIITSGKERFKSQIHEKIDFIAQNFRNVQLGKQHFTAENIRLLCKEYQVNPNFIFGFSNQVFTKKSLINPVNKNDGNIRKSA